MLLTNHPSDRYYENKYLMYQVSFAVINRWLTLRQMARRYVYDLTKGVDLLPVVLSERVTAASRDKGQAKEHGYAFSQ